MKKEISHFLTTSDAAKLCAVDTSTVLNWIKAGKLKSFHTAGGHNRILKDDLWFFVKENGLPFEGQRVRLASSHKKILCVDDDPDFLFSLKILLKGENAWVLDTADSSLDAGLKVGSWHPDLVIMDLNMPGFDGIDFCHFLKKNFGYDKLPVIIVTGVTKTAEEKNEIKKMGIFDYIEKPFLPQALVQKIRLFFGSSAT